MRRVVITGLGVVSPIGNSSSEVLHSLKNGISGIGSVSYTHLTLPTNREV